MNMNFEIEEITKSIKKNPTPWLVGGALAVIAGIAIFRRKQDGYITTASPELPVLPTENEIATGTAKPGDITDAMLQELLVKLEQGRHEDLQQIAEWNAKLMENLSKSLESYVKQQPPYQQPIPQIPPEQIQQDLYKKAETIYNTPSIYFQPKGASYTPQQVDVMYNWALEENLAISRGYGGTSKTPEGLAQSGMEMVFYPTGHVEFRPRGSSGGSSPSHYADTPAGQALKTAHERESSGYTREAVSRITGKSGSIEEQLSGMSASEKLSTLRAAGLID